MPRKGENVYKRKDGRWEGRYIKGRTSDGKAIYGYLYASSYRELKNKMAHTDRFNKVSSNTLDDIQQISFQAIAQDWINSVQPHIKESTNIKYSNLLNNYILPQLGEYSIESISYEIIKKFCNKMLLTGGAKGMGLSAKTVADILSLVRRILRQAKDQGYKLLCDGTSIVIKQQRKEIRVLSLNEQHILCDYLCEHLDERNIGILICLFTGIRIGEICALKWKDVSVSEQTIWVHSTMQRLQMKENAAFKTKIVISAPKSPCSIRMIPVPEKLIKIIEKYKKAENAYILTGLENKYVEPRTMQNHFYRIIKKCSIDKANFHSLRHTFATRCVELGFDTKSLSEILGHSSVNITMNRYIHPSMDLKKENMKRLSALIAVKK